MLPRESKTYAFDLSQLSLVWPYKVVNKKQAMEIINNVEYHLVRDRGVVRHKNDYYYNADPDGYSKEAEWTFGFMWLAIIYKMFADKELAKEYFDLAVSVQNDKGEMPELYYSNSKNTAQ